MERKYFTIVGTSHHFGSDFMEPKMKVRKLDTSILWRYKKMDEYL